MTISTNVRRAGPFTGTGLTVDYPFGFKVFVAEDVSAYISDTNGSERKLNYPDEYTVTLNDDQETHPGGLLRLITALDTGHLLSIISEMPVTQPVEFTNTGGFYPRTLNDSLDRLTIYIQQLQEMINRTITAGVNTITIPSMPNPTPDRFLYWDENRQLSNLSLSTLTNDETFGDDKKLATTKAIKSVKELIDTANSQLSSLKDEVDELRRLLNASGGAIPISFVQRVEAVEQSVQSAINSAASALSTAQTAESNAESASYIASAALPKNGGVLTGNTILRKSDEYVGFAADNQKGDGKGSVYTMMRGGVTAASVEGRFKDDGSTVLSFLATKAGDKASDRREEMMRLENGKLWVQELGLLDEVFAKKSDIDNDDRYHYAAYPNHLQGAEVWWDKKTKLKIILMRFVFKQDFIKYDWAYLMPEEVTGNFFASWGIFEPRGSIFQEYVLNILKIRDVNLNLIRNEPGVTPHNVVEITGNNSHLSYQKMQILIVGRSER